MQRVDVIVTNCNMDSGRIVSGAFSALHFHLVKRKDIEGFVKIGIGFPEYGKKIGNIISVYGEEDDLRAFNVQCKLKFIKECIHVSNMRPVTDQKAYANFSRVRYRKSPMSRIRRAMKRRGLAESEAIEQYRELIDKGKPIIEYPFLHHQSISTSQTFIMPIKKTTVETLARKFNPFGFPVDGGGVPE